MSARPFAIVAGAGPGLGLAVARRFAREGFAVALLARNGERLAELAAREPAGALLAVVCDLTQERDVARAFDDLSAHHGAPQCVVFNAFGFAPGQVVDLAPSEFERCWRSSAYAGFLVGQAAARLMLPQGSGTILFTGGGLALKAEAGLASLAAQKFALRGLAQAMARELGPKGIHVAHVVIDGPIRSPRTAKLDPALVLDPDAIAENYWQLHTQPPSAFAFELDLRPAAARF